MFELCFNCGSNSVGTKITKRTYYFRGQKLQLELDVKYCKTCGYVYKKESESQIIRKIHEAYIQENSLLNSDNVKYIRINGGLSQNQFDKELGFISGTINAIENGYALKKEEDEKIKEWLNNRYK